MEQAMIASEMTDGQIDNLVSKLRDALRKHRLHINSEVAQQVLGLPNIGMDMYAPIRAHAEAISKLVVRRAAVDRTRSLHEALSATGRQLYVDDSVVKKIPTASGNIEAIFVNLAQSVDCDKLDDELNKRGFELIVDPQGLAAINEADPDFADKYPNGTQWKNANGKYCCAVFDAWFGKRHVGVNQNDSYWRGRWWFPCRRKSVLKT